VDLLLSHRSLSAGVVLFLSAHVSSAAVFLQTKQLSKAERFKLDELELTNGKHGEVKILCVSRSAVVCLVGSSQVPVPLSRVRRAHLCDGTRIEKGERQNKDEVVLASGQTVATRLRRLVRTKDDTFQAHIVQKTDEAVHEIRLANGTLIYPGYGKVVEGWGWRRIHLGMTREEIDELLEGPLNLAEYGWLLYRFPDKRCVSISLKNGRVAGILLYPKSRGELLRSGVRATDPIEKVFRVYGKPRETKEADKAGGESRVLYHVGGRSRLIYAGQGIQFRFAGELLDLMTVIPQTGRQYDSIRHPLEAPAAEREAQALK